MYENEEPRDKIVCVCVCVERILGSEKTKKPKLRERKLLLDQHKKHHEKSNSYRNPLSVVKEKREKLEKKISEKRI